MQDANGKLFSQWNNNYSKIVKKVLNGKRTIQEAKNYMEKEYIYDGSSQKAFRYLMDVHPSDSNLERKLYCLLEDAVNLGHGKDLNFENVFR